MPPTPEALEQAFLDDIVAHPDDPSLWLILADWLDERTDPRGELVRLTWQLHYEPEHADFDTRQARMQALLVAGVKPVRPRQTLNEIEFAWIPPGTFLMGSPDDEAERKNDETYRRVTLTAPFWMGVYPITQRQWLDVMGSNPSHFNRNSAGQSAVTKIRDAELERFPVETVSWNSASDFCARLGKALRKKIRLPTEAQWEYACRAGTTTPFHFGTKLNAAYGNFGTYPASSSRRTTLQRPVPVGSYFPNAWGLYDVHGNVWEWCQDVYRADLSELPECDPVVKRGRGGQRAMRGGSWFDNVFRARCAYRHQVSRGTGASALGLRVCFR
jgi:uncharacterized protein (TIGR02996 family)